ncbi:MAG: hypothetical protein M4579_005507 [Chaenotheca gracillima]|nr:MAG: hypothetical protein M4579_005507 [Chaenotheca gracillima]
MNWDQEIYGFPNSSAQPPTPSATPTSATAPGFDPTTFQTPKSSGGHFEAQFPWGTSPLADYSSSYNQSPGTFRDSTFANFSTPSQRLAGATTDNRFFANHGESSPTFIRRSASEFPLFTKDTLGQTQPPPGRSPTQGARPGSDDAQLAGSMQTPPPTSTSALKRQNLRPRALAAKPETRHLNEQSLFEQEFRSRGENPPLRTMEGLDFHPMFVTASAPVYPPQNILWDPESNMALDPVDNNFMRPSHDRQGNISGHETSFSSPQYPYLAQNTRRSPVGLSSGPLSLTENRDRKRSSFLDTSSLSSPAEDSYEPSRVSASSLSNSELSQAVDPNLLYSTPSRPTKPNRSLSTTAPSYPGTQLRSTLPYQHQQQELRREQELERTWKRRQPSPSKGKPLSGSAARKSIVGATARPRLERSVTDGALKPSKIQRYQDRSKASYAGTDTQEESSYLPVNSQSFTTRQLDPTGRSGQPYQTRTAINFTIDSNGRALVETRPANEDLVMESTSSGSESGYSETGDARVFHSHQSSFAFAQAPSTWKTTQFRGSQSNAELPRSRSSSFRTRPPNSQDLRASRSEVEGEAETIVPESERHGDAAVALRKVLSKRHKSRNNVIKQRV